MPLPSLSLLRARPAFLGGRARRILLWALAAAGYAVLVVYHAGVMVVGAPPSTTTLAVANAGTAAWFGLLAVLLSDLFSRRAMNPVRSLWVPLVMAGLGYVLAAGLVAATGGPAAVDVQTGLPVGFGSALQMAGVALVEAVVALGLLFSLRALVLFKRTHASVRNWWLMLGAMGVAAVALLGTGPLDEVNDSVVYIVLTAFAVVAMLLNAFRLSWIVYLPFRQKLATIGLCLALIVVLGYGMGARFDDVGVTVREGGSLAGDSLVLALSGVFSQPLSQFVMMAFGFGILYATTALLSLLFHLPTAAALQQKSGEMEAIQALARLSTEVFDREKLVDTISSAPVEAGVAQAAWLALIDPGSGSLRPRLAAATGLTPVQIRALTDYEALATDAAAKKAPLVLAHAPADHRVRARPGDGIGSLVVIPLLAHEEALGALFATRAVSEGFEDDDVAALQTFAGQAALALNNADLVAERIQFERLERELAIAREVQQRLLPQRLPRHRGLGLAALSLPAEEVAGDFYDFVEIGPHCVGVLVGDVSGKGTSAAFYMAELKGIFQSVSRLTRSPAEFLARANEALADSLGKNAFITAVYGVLEADAGRFTLARAGHCPVALARADGSVELLRSGGLGLGLDRGPLFERALQEQTVTLRPGDTFVLYTDGLVEARNHAGEEFGYDRLAHVLARHRHLDPDAIRGALLSELKRFSGRERTSTAPWEDDLTLVVLQWAGTEAAVFGDGAEGVHYGPAEAAGAATTPEPARTPATPPA